MRNYQKYNKIIQRARLRKQTKLPYETKLTGIFIYLKD